MALAAAYEDSASISTTEYSLPNDGTTLTPITVDGVYQLFLDLSALTATEQYRLRFYERVQAAGTTRVFHEVTFSGAQGEPVYVSPSFLLLHGWDITLQKLQGTDRSIPWSIRQVA